MKRIFILLGVVLLLLSGTMLWAEGKQEKKAEAEGPVTITLMSREDPAAIGDFTKKGLYRYLLDKFNIDLQINPVAGSAYPQKFQVAVMSGDMPDMIAGLKVDITTVNQLGQNGVIEELGQYYDRMPNLSAFFKKYPAEKEYIADANGNSYTFGSGEAGYQYEYGCCVQNDMLKKVGFDVSKVDTFEDYINMFKALRDANGGKPPLQNRKGLNKMMKFGMWSIGRDRRYIYYDRDNDRWGFPYLGEDAKYVINWYRTLFKEGIYHPDAITYSDESWEPEMRAGGVWHALLSDSVNWALESERRLKLAGKFPDMDFVPVKPPKYKGRQYQWPVEHIYRPEVIIKANLDKRKMDKIITLMDWLYSPDGLSTVLYGIKDRDWFSYKGYAYTLFAGPDGKPTYPAEAKPPAPLRPNTEQDQFTKDWGTIWKFVLLVPDRARYSTGEDKFVDLYRPMYSVVYQGKPNPSVHFDESVIEEVNNLRNNLHTTSWEWIAKFLTGLEPMSKWDKFQAQLKKLGVERYEQLWNEAYKKSK